MDIIALKYFLKVAETQHMTKAAQSLHITQPALTAIIRRLEADVGAPLFDRVGRNIQLNAYGTILRDYAKTAVSALDAAQHKISELQKQNASKIRLVCPGSVATSELIDKLISESDNSIDVYSIHGMKEDDILKTEVDFIITITKHESTVMECIPLCDNDFVIVASPNHPLAGESAVTVDDLRQYDFASLHSSFSVESVLEPQLMKYNFFPRVTFRGTDISNQTKAIRSGMYLGIVTKDTLSKHPDLIALPVENFKISMTQYLYWNKSRENNPYIRRVLNTIRSYYQDTRSDNG